MREIEIKASIKDKANVLKALKRKNVAMSAPVKQHDVVYSIEGTKDNAPNSVWLRIRTEDDRTTIFTLKKQHRGGLDSIEHETEVADAKELQEIIRNLGFVLYSDLTKTRQKGKFGQTEICLDEVEGLGTFLEAERLADVDADGDKVEAELWTILESLGISREEEILEGYDVLDRARHQQ